MTREDIDALYRRESGAIRATLIRRLGDFDLAEEALQEAFAAAVQQWPSDGRPEEPVAWLVQTAKHKAIDRLRRGSLYTEKLGALPRSPPSSVRSEARTTTTRSRTISSGSCSRVAI